MRVVGVDERMLSREQDHADFLLFIYQGSADPGCSWSVDSRLMIGANLPQAMWWLRGNLPLGCCWSLGVIRDPRQPTTGTHLDVVWIVGADVLNNSEPTEADQAIAREMLERRERLPTG